MGPLLVAWDWAQLVSHVCPFFPGVLGLRDRLLVLSTGLAVPVDHEG